MSNSTIETTNEINEEEKISTENIEKLYNHAIAQLFDSDSIQDKINNYVGFIYHAGMELNKSIKSEETGIVCNECKQQLELDYTNKCNDMELLSNKIDSLSEANKVLKKECTEMKSKLNHIIHTPSIVYMSGTSIIFSFFFTLLILQIFMGIYIIHPYIVVTSIIGSVGLFLTALFSLNHWKEHMNGKR